MNDTIDNDELNIGSKNMKKEMKFPPNGIGNKVHGKTKSIIAVFIRQKIKKDKWTEGKTGRIDNRVKKEETKTIKKTNGKGDFGVNAVDNSSPRKIRFSPKIKTGKE